MAYFKSAGTKKKLDDTALNNIAQMALRKTAQDTAQQTTQQTANQPAKQDLQQRYTKLNTAQPTTQKTSSLSTGTARNRSATVQNAANVLANSTNLAQQYGGVYQAMGSNGQAYKIGSDKGINFLQNAKTGETMVGGDGSIWYMNPDGSVSITTKGGHRYTTQGYRTMAEGNADLQAAYQDLFDQLNNYAPFEYDPATDPAYQAYKKQYTREGQRAMEDTMGQYAAMTGGMPSTAAMTAASQANDYYMAQLADRIPELYQLAYSMYADDYNRLANRYGMAYQQYLDDLDNNWKGLYNQQDMAQQQWSNDLTMEQWLREQAQQDLDRDYQERYFKWQQDTDARDFDWTKESFYADLNADKARAAAAASQQAIDNDIAYRNLALKEQEAAVKAQQQAAAEQKAINQAAAKRLAQDVVNTGMNVAMGRQPLAATSSGGNLVQTTAQTGTNNVLTQAAQAKAEYEAFLKKVDQGYSPTDADAKKFGLSDVELIELRMRAKKAKLLAAKK